MAVAKVQSNGTSPQNTSNTATCAFLSNSTAASVLLVYIVAASQAKSFTVSDTLVNGWVSAAAQNLFTCNGTAMASQVWYVKSSLSTGANTVSVAYGGAKVGVGIEIVEISGCDATNPLDQYADSTPVQGTTVSNGQVITSASVTPGVAGELIWGGISYAIANHTMNAGSGYTALNNPTTSLGVQQADEYEIQGAAAGITATFTYGGVTISGLTAGNFGMSIASFKPPAAGGNWLKEGYLWQRATESSGVF